ncbi:MAG: alginate lyase family protein [Melioribacteraceae bacterium]|nr:alginate lyase family protein [Melioribacteraceae bacterium]
MILYRIILLLISVIVISLASCHSAKEVNNSLHPPYLIDYKELTQTRINFRQKKEPIFTFGKNLIIEADKWLDSSYSTVVNKLHIPPSGDKHDYYSLGPYWWPDSTKVDGLPYIRKDGYRNPERLEYDRPHLANMVEAVKNLTLAYVLSNNEKYKNKSVEFLKTWFINEDTKMNPHLEYGQAIPGITEGRGIGIIETRGLVDVIDAIGILYRENALDKNDYNAFKNWFKEYHYWLANSKKGIDEKEWYNNHGTTYDLQVLSFSLFIDDSITAKSVLDSVISKRIIRQIEPDGTQPHELARTKSLSYSILNLKSFVGIALFAEKLNVNLWEYESIDGRSIAKAIIFLTPFLFEGIEWQHQELTDFNHLKISFFEILNISNHKNVNLNFDEWLKFYDIKNYEVQKEMLIRPNKILMLN